MPLQSATSIGASPLKSFVDTAVSSGAFWGVRDHSFVARMDTPCDRDGNELSRAITHTLVVCHVTVHVPVHPCVAQAVY